MIATLIADALVIDDLAAADKDAVLKAIVKRVVDAKRLPKRSQDAVLERLRSREKLGSTGIGNGVAVPHVKGDEIKKLSLVVARIKAGVDYKAIDGRAVTTLFLILAPLARPEDHLQALRWISGLARNADFRRFFLAAADAAAIRELLTEMGEVR